MRLLLPLAVLAAQISSSMAEDWYVGDWYLKGNAIFTYPMLNVLPGDSITFEWNSTIHGMNDVWIYPSQECDEDIGSALVSYTSPAVYNFTQADAGKVMLFVNSVGRRCQSGVSLYANVSQNVLSSGSNDTVASTSNDTVTTTDTENLIEVNDTLVNETVDEAVFDMGGENIAIGIQSKDSGASKQVDSASSSYRLSLSSPMKLLTIVSVCLIPIT